MTKEIRDLIAALEHMSKKPKLYVGLEIESMPHFLNGVDFVVPFLTTWEVYRTTFQETRKARGWRDNPMLEVLLKEKGLDKHQIADELITLRIETWRKILERMDEKYPSELARQVEDAFSNMAYPGDAKMVAHPNTSIAAGLVRDFTGKHWNDISLELIFQARLDLPLFTSEGFRFYLPAFLRAALLYPDETDTLRENIFYCLTPPDGDDAEKDLFLDRMNGFTEQQIEVIKSFVKLYISTETSYPDPNRAKVDKFWSQK